MTTPKIVAPKKLIEVALPLDDINRACAREKSIRHGHPSTLHLWWARRPLAAARAVLFAQLVNDPSWKYSNEDLKKPAIKGVITKRRSELFKLISELVLWENTTNERVLERARAEIRASWRETCDANKDHPGAKSLFDPRRLPAFHDPFAGGGAIPLEAQRLGLESHATDLNPVAVIINKAMIEIPPKFAGRAPVGPVQKTEKQTKAKATEDWSGARGLAEDVRRYGEWVQEEAAARIGRLYPKAKITKDLVAGRPDLKIYEGQELQPIAWLWARTVASPNPAARGALVPLVSNYMLSTKHDQAVWVEPVVDGISFRFELRLGKPGARRAALEHGSRAGKAQDFTCLITGTPITREYVRDEGKAGRLGQRLMAIVVEVGGSRTYLPPTVGVADLLAADAERAVSARKTMLNGATPTRAMITGGVCSAYGLTTWGSLFTDRQIVCLTTISDLIETVWKRAKEDAVSSGIPDDTLGLEDGGSGAVAYADAIACYLALGTSKMTDYNSSLVTWSVSRDQARNTFGRQALPMTWDFTEVNPFADAAGNLQVSLAGIARALESVPAGPSGTAEQHVAQYRRPGRALVSTDPPYYDNISYSELSDYFYAWLRRCLRTRYPKLFETILTPKREELIAAPFRHGGKKEADEFFVRGMGEALSAVREEAHDCAVPVTIYYAFKQSETEEDGTASSGWETFLEAVRQAGLAVVGTWPIRTERESRTVASGTNALASSIVLVCRPRSLASTCSRRDFVRELEATMPAALTEMTADPIASIAPVDLAQAAIGPGMGIFSKYDAVLEADGSSMTIHNALVHINKAIDDYFAHAEGDLDADTRFCIGWFEQFGFETGAFGMADVLARAKGTSVDGVKEAGVVKAGKGDVRLYKVNELPKGWDPTKDDRVPVWEACHHMCRALGDSEGDAGALLAKMPEKQEAIRLLAYRLYTICERKKWAEQAGAYNELITSWPAIVEASHGVGHVRTQMELV